jgi:hypothetical protein
MADQHRMVKHRPEPTNHGMHCTCGVFCGRGIESWRAHRDDILILRPGADTLERRMSDLERWQTGLEAIGKAYGRMFESGIRAVNSFAAALAAELRRSNEARARQARIDSIAFLNRPVVTPPNLIGGGTET